MGIRVEGNRWHLGICFSICAILCRAGQGHFYHMRRCIKGPDIEAKVEAFAELLGSLQPVPGKETVDERLLIDTSQSSWYAWLLPASHSPFLESDLYKKNRLVWHTRHRLLRHYCSDAGISYESSLAGMEPLLQYDTMTRDSLPDYSESMAFHGQLLRQIVEQPDITSGNSISFYNTLIVPLVRRTWNGRKRVGVQQLKEVIDLSLKCVNVHPRRGQTA
jgi:hypothetical protein